MSLTGGILAATTAASLGGAALTSNAAGNAASTQAQAANNAAQLQYQSGQNALGFQQQVFNQQQANVAPWLQTGRTSLANLGYLLGLPNAGTGTPPAMNFPGLPTPNGIGMQPSPMVGGMDSGFGGPPNNQAPAQALQMKGEGINRVASPGPDGSSLTGPAATSLAGPSGAQPGLTGQPGATGDPNSLGQYVNPALGGYGSIMGAFNTPFVAPTNVTEQNDPGYQFRLDQATKGIQNSAAANGTLLSGGTLKALDRYNQDYASNEYNNVYGRALQQYQVGQNNATSQFNMLAALSGVGQTAGQQLNQAGANAANNASSTLFNTAQSIGQQQNNAAAARASGYVGGANAWSGALGGIGNNLSLLALLGGFGGGGGGSMSGLGPNDIGVCWIAAELYGGWHKGRTRLVRMWLDQVFRDTAPGAVLLPLYAKYGERMAKLVKRFSFVRRFFQPIFDAALGKAIAWAEA